MVDPFLSVLVNAKDSLCISGIHEPHKQLPVFPACTSAEHKTQLGNICWEWVSAKPAFYSDLQALEP